MALCQPFLTNRLFREMDFNTPNVHISVTIAENWEIQIIKLSEFMELAKLSNFVKAK